MEESQEIFQYAMNWLALCFEVGGYTVTGNGGDPKELWTALAGSNHGNKDLGARALKPEAEFRRWSSDVAENSQTNVPNFNLLKLEAGQGYAQESFGKTRS